MDSDIRTRIDDLMEDWIRHCDFQCTRIYLGRIEWEQLAEEARKVCMILTDNPGFEYRGRKVLRVNEENHLGCG